MKFKVNLMIETILNLVSALSLGSLIIRYYDQKKPISDIDKKRFSLYKDIYFNSVKNSFDEKIDSDIAKNYLIELCNEIKYDEDKSLLISRDLINLLRKFYYDFQKDDHILYKVQSQSEKEFRILLKKFGYIKSINTNIINLFIEILSVICLFIADIYFLIKLIVEIYHFGIIATLFSGEIYFALFNIISGILIITILNIWDRIYILKK